MIEPINEMMHSGRYAYIIATADWHPADHASFQRNGGKWPAHCVRGTHGALLDHRLQISLLAEGVIYKGTRRDHAGYSAFEHSYIGDMMFDDLIDEAHVVGLALDYCVKATALDARESGFNTFVHTSATRPVSVETGESAMQELVRNGVWLRND